MLQRTRNRRVKTVLVAGGAGFVGSHLCDAMLARGDRVICVDSYVTGSEDNVRPLINHPRFRLIGKDICPLDSLAGPWDEIYNLAGAAWPPKYRQT
ncbi:NAD-dependent epimerase/dehydratase family protein, partial [Rhizobium sp. SEMIA 4085]|uniref:NAD-dependent epimerase/dehydratase family protein n=1 Tax=Rhizobium sp. SEMIA 4085 TaxID=2137761 RepID=UPI0014794992